jgi:hypothetical protein
MDNPQPSSKSSFSSYRSEEGGSVPRVGDTSAVHRLNGGGLSSLIV